MIRFLGLAFTVCALMLGATSAGAAQTTDPNQKVTVTDQQYRLIYSQEIPGNCGVYSFSQWEANKFKGWVPYQTSVTRPNGRIDTFPVSKPPLYDDQLTYGGVVVSPPSGSHWVSIGGGSHIAAPPPAEPGCQAMLDRSHTATIDGKVTTYYQRTPLCVSKLNNVNKAKKARKRAKGRRQRAKARKKYSNAKKSFARSCSK